LVEWQDGQLTHKRHVPLIAKGSLLEQMEKESQGNQLTQVHLENDRGNRRDGAGCTCMKLYHIIFVVVCNAWQSTGYKIIIL